MAATNGNLGNVKLLVDAGADVNFKTSGGATALKAAALMSQVYNVKYLLIEKHADFNDLFGTAQNGQKLYLVDYMRNWPFDKGSTEWKAKMEIVEYLRQRGMDYTKAPIPKKMYKLYSKEFIEKY